MSREFHRTARAGKTSRSDVCNSPAFQRGDTDAPEKSVP
jgi:hypothetical protein